MRSVTTPLFPAQIEGAVTLQAVIDAREGDRLPLELALYVSGELGKQVVELQAMGREGSLDPQRVWCTSKGAVVVHEAAPGEPKATVGTLVYRLLSGSREVSDWPPSYFNPSVAESLDAAVMSAMTGAKEDTKAMVDAVNVAVSGLDQEASVTGMARLVFAVSDEPKPKPAPRLTSISVEMERFAAPPPPAWIAAARGWLTPPRAAVIGGLLLVILVGCIGLAISGSKAPKAEAVAQTVEPVAPAPTIREKTVAAFHAQKALKTASAKAATAKKGRGKK